MKKRIFLIKPDGDNYNIFLRKYPNHPLDKNGFPDKKSAKQRLNEYIRKVKHNEVCNT